MLATAVQPRRLTINCYRYVVDVDTSTTPHTVSIALRGNVVGTFTVGEGVTSYAQQMTRVGGFDSMRFSLSTKRQLTAEEWLRELPGCFVEVTDQGGIVAWAGFVNSVGVTFDDLKVKVGPMTDVGNRTQLAYSQLQDVSINTPNEGYRVVTPWAENEVSQRRYGLQIKQLSTGGVTETLADVIVNSWLDANRWPRVTQDFAFQPGTQAVYPVSVECLGFWHAMQYPYTYVDTTWSSAGGLLRNIDVDAKIARVLAADPNGILSTADDSLASNTLQVPEWEQDDKSAQSHITALVSYGDAAYNVYSFGIYEDQRAIYAICDPDDPLHIAVHSSKRGVAVVRDRGGNELYPWMVRPGNFVRYTDLFSDYVSAEGLPFDITVQLIETATFTWPNALSLNGGQSDRPRQILAKYGMRGA